MSELGDKNLKNNKSKDSDEGKIQSDLNEEKKLIKPISELNSTKSFSDKQNENDVVKENIGNKNVVKINTQIEEVDITLDKINKHNLNNENIEVNNVLKFDFDSIKKDSNSKELDSKCSHEMEIHIDDQKTFTSKNKNEQSSDEHKINKEDKITNTNSIENIDKNIINHDLNEKVQLKPNDAKNKDVIKIIDELKIDDLYSIKQNNQLINTTDQAKVVLIKNEFAFKETVENKDNSLSENIPLKENTLNKENAITHNEKIIINVDTIKYQKK